jgi:hypothetical protein
MAMRATEQDVDDISYHNRPPTSAVATPLRNMRSSRSAVLPNQCFVATICSLPRWRKASPANHVLPCCD